MYVIHNINNYQVYYVSVLMEQWIKYQYLGSSIKFVIGILEHNGFEDKYILDLRLPVGFYRKKIYDAHSRSMTFKDLWTSIYNVKNEQEHANSNLCISLW